MWTYNYNNQTELYHHGILGQRWGRRNGPPYPLGQGQHSFRERLHLRKYGIKPEKENIKTKKSSNNVPNQSPMIQPKKQLPNPHAMSDDELRKALDRLSMEKRYSDLLKQMYGDPEAEKKKQHKILKAMGGLLAKPLKSVSQDIITYGLKQLTNSTFESMGKGPIFDIKAIKQDKGDKKD